MNSTMAAVVAKVHAAEEFNPRLFGAVLAVSAVLLIASAFPPRDDRRSCDIG